MPHASKIATCCYCGTRAALVLRGETRHELACSSCGAPLHDLKQMPMTGETVHKDISYTSPLKTRKSKKKSKKRKSRRKDWFDDLFDVIEDIFD